MDKERQSENERDYEVVDRRARAKERSDDSAEPDDKATDDKATDDEADAGIPPEILDLMVPPSVDVAAEIALGHMQRLAWEHLGLRPSARTGEVAANLPEARRAVDAVEFLVGLLSPTLDERARRDLNSLVSDLKLNYVRQEHSAASE